MTPLDAKRRLSNLTALWHHRADYSDEPTVFAMASNAKAAIAAWEAHDAQHGGETQWAKSTEEYLERLEDRIKNPPAKAPEERPIDLRPTRSWLRHEAAAKNEREREYLAALAKKGAA